MPPHDRTTTIPRPEPAAPALPTFTGYRDLLGLIRQLSSLGGCAQPIRLEGQRTEIDACWVARGSLTPGLPQNGA
ncbi:hypothetical protein ACIBTP_42105 [Streptomyces avidinii]|uniref:hypothetical protein n=1 Tax=Streptomyces avidinii TaxID=1895 RepID=UPI0037A68176